MKKLYIALSILSVLAALSVVWWWAWEEHYYPGTAPLQWWGGIAALFTIFVFIGSAALCAHLASETKP